jgi:hypothetical protein
MCWLTKKGIFGVCCRGGVSNRVGNRGNSCYGARDLRVRGPLVRVSRGAQGGQRGPRKGPRKVDAQEVPGKVKEG